MAIWDALAEGRTPRRYRAGQVVYLQGTMPDRFYYLISGAVRSFISTEDGGERVLTVHRSGDLMGEASFFDGCPRVTSAMALEDCLILPIDQGQLDAAFQRHPELALPMLQYLARTVRILSDQVARRTYSVGDSYIAGCGHPRYDETPAEPVTVALRPLAAGSTGPQVKTVQRILYSYGFKGADGRAIAVDGEYGPNTAHAVRSAQKKLGIPTDGAMGADTWRVMLTELT